MPWSRHFRQAWAKPVAEPLPIFALHGWGLNAAVMAPLDGVVDGRRLITVDLPGHGTRRDDPFGRDLETLANDVLARAPERAVWLGWSLGGMLALAAASMAPERVTALVTVAASPSFVARPDWPCGMPGERLHRMAADLSADPHQTVNDFLTLQVLSSRGGRQALRQLQSALNERGMAGQQALDDGLHLLETMDLRPRLRGLRMPLLAMGGARDRLVRPAAVRALAEAAPEGSACIFEDAAHAPFLSHRELFARRVSDFLRDREGRS